MLDRDFTLPESLSNGQWSLRETRDWNIIIQSSPSHTIEEAVKSYLPPVLGIQPSDPEPHISHTFPFAQLVKEPVLKRLIKETPGVSGFTVWLES